MPTEQLGQGGIFFKEMMNEGHKGYCWKGQREGTFHEKHRALIDTGRGRDT